MDRIYLDSAASSPLDSEVLDYMIPFYKDYVGNPSSVHGHGRKIRASIEGARKTVAKVLGASPSEIFFTSGGTEADNMAIKCSVVGLDLKRVISTRIEHHAVDHSIDSICKMTEAEALYLDVDSYGRIDLKHLEDILSDGVPTLVSIMHANNEIGTITDINAIGDICHKYDACFHSDTVQSMGILPYNLSEMKVDFVTGSAHKFYGPKGVGFLYAKAGKKLPTLICGGGQERNMRAGTENFASIMGLAYALEKCYSNLETKNEKLWDLKSYMKEKLKGAFDFISFNGDVSQDGGIPTVLNVSFGDQGEDPMLLFNLDIQGISASGGSACTSGTVKGSHVLKGIGIEGNKSISSVRFSFNVTNTKEEIDLVVEKLHNFVKVPVS